jgi:hypothetical protein
MSQIMTAFPDDVVEAVADALRYRDEKWRQIPWRNLADSIKAMFLDDAQREAAALERAAGGVSV